MSFVPNPAVVDGCYWQPCFSLPFALYELLRIQGLDRPTADVARRGACAPASPRSRKLPGALCCGLAFAPFLLGSLWMQAFPLAGSSVQGGEPAGLPSAGPLVAMALIGFATSRITSYDQARKLFWSSCPLLPLSSSITPSLEECCCLIGTCLSRIFKTAVRFAWCSAPGHCCSLARAPTGFPLRWSSVPALLWWRRFPFSEPSLLTRSAKAAML